MIELSANTAFMLYLGMTLAVLLGIWTWQSYDSRRNKSISLEQELFVCEYCHFAYLEEGIKEVTRCPQCQSFNKHNTWK
jgi:uncharacterized paraquat-inducible protein A